MVLKVYLIGFLNVKIYPVLKVYRDMIKDYMDIWQKNIYLFGINKYTTPIEWPWAFVDMNNGKRTDA